MSTEPAGGLAAYKLPRHLSPDQVRDAAFERAPFGRRGFDEHEVQGYLERVAEEMASRDVEIARLAGENRQLKHALREWHRQLVGYDSAEIIARTQQHIEAQISQAESFSREREEEAARRYEEILAEARQRAQDEAERYVYEQGASSAKEADERDRDHERARGDREWLARQTAYVGALRQALDSLASQVNATRQAFTFEADKLGDIASAPGSALASAAAPSSISVREPGPGPGSGSEPSFISVLEPGPETAPAPLSASVTSPGRRRLSDVSDGTPLETLASVTGPDPEGDDGADHLDGPDHPHHPDGPDGSGSAEAPR